MKISTMIRGGLAWAVAVVCCVAAAAQDEEGRIEGYDKVQPVEPVVVPRKPMLKPQVAAPPDAAGREKGDKVEDPRNLVETVMMVRLAEVLDLDDEQTVVMVRRLRELKETMTRMRRERGERYRELKEALRDGADPGGIEAKLDALLAHDRELETFKQDRLRDLSVGLSVTQRAQLYIFLCEFEDDMRHLVHRAQGRSDEWRTHEGEWRDREWRGREREPGANREMPDGGGGPGSR